MKTAFWAILAIGVATVPALAQNPAQNSAQMPGADPTGVWRVADGGALIRVVDCGNALWGVVAWERNPGRDVHNPDPALRRRPTLGMPVLLRMRPSDDPGHWEGNIYNAKDGQTYDASIALRSADTLHVEGCALGIFCGGEDWTRVQQPAQRYTGSVNGTTGDAGPVTAPAAAICSSIARIPGRPH